MRKFPVRVGDQVVVISGDHKGKKGVVKKILRDKDRIIIQGVNLIKKAVRKSQKYPEGGIIETEGTIHISNVKLVAKGPTRKPE